MNLAVANAPEKSAILMQYLLLATLLSVPADPVQAVYPDLHLMASNTN